jgi:23S rRNA (guanosine2251-2'-O)-methyltransferase
MNAARRQPSGGNRKRPAARRPTTPPKRAQGTARPPKAKVVPTRSTRKRIGVNKSQAAGRTGGPGGERPRRDGKGLGGEQVEGRQAVRELLVAGRRRVHELWLSADLAGDDAVADITDLARAGRVPVAHVAKSKLEARAKSEAPQGVIAFAAELPEANFDDLVGGRRGRRPFLVAVDGVTDPGNLGAILRSCDGAGVDGVLIPRHRAVHVTPTVAKAAAGAVEHVPITLVGGLPATLTRLRAARIWVVGLDDAAERSLFDLGDLATEGICLVLGAEGAGLSRLVRERCDAVVRIPMLGRIGSLNVSAAAALATYEVARHRT